ncbi:BZIP domain-containing protein [Mycena chlorophos]|uniref:X-box-binding protein 1 n=1 Tax=Mycena chlorophos TaxID=658473 RepID=A0A8H6STU5_MYCCL|nr:BZIP domain-containing protein [Mycena chlorophos]
MSPSVDPSSISMSPSPEPEEQGPSRKRQRTSTSSEERKEARAHRNRIAAQNSRDRRKAQFSYLERRVSELEEENRQLRAGIAVPPAQQQDRDRENEELRARIRTLEEGWNVVVKALAANGVPMVTAAPATTAPPPPPATAPVPEQPAAAPEPVVAAPADSFQEPTMSFPLSPAPTTSSLDFDLSSPPSFMSSPLITPKTEEEPDSARHLARVASTPVAVASPEETVIDDATMDDLFREILAPSPSLVPANLPFDAPPAVQFQDSAESTSPAAPYPPQMTPGDILGLEGLVGSSGATEVDGDNSEIWTGELEVDMLEMDRILELLPAADAAFQQNLDQLNIDIGLSWADVSAEPNLVGVF